ncbi:MAG: hypothetical protein ABW152_08775 [Candidatus Thiodiazotropha endolucinida]
MSMKEAVQQIGQHANMMPIESDITLPMVKVENNRVIVRELIYYTHTTVEYGTVITEPQYIASYDLTGGTFITLKRFEMDVPNLKPPPWIHNRPAFDKPEDIIPEFEKIWTLYDILIPAFLKGDDGVSAEIKLAAKEFVYYFERHAEKPLLPYYDVFSGDFLLWIGRVANS